ncbi:MAG TPA: hypothetical protein VFT74_13460 [Isosphaeraceae bacterium]|nr:hypothetical protein [Isosphaeraceae bacterium]
MRARNIKPNLFKNELLGQADPLLTILFAGLWCLADREGILEDRPLRIQAEVFPYRQGTDIEGLLDRLEIMGFIHRYQAQDLRLISVVNFTRHQHPHKTERASVFPKPTTRIHGGPTVNSPCPNGETPPDSLNPDSLKPDSLIPEPRDARSHNEGGRAAGEEFILAGDDLVWFEKLWESWPEEMGGMKSRVAVPISSKHECQRRFAKTMKDEGLIAIELAHACKFYANACEDQRSYLKALQNVLGPEKWWSAYLDRARKAASEYLAKKALEAQTASDEVNEQQAAEDPARTA